MTSNHLHFSLEEYEGRLAKTRRPDVVPPELAGALQREVEEATGGAFDVSPGDVVVAGRETTPVGQQRRVESEIGRWHDRSCIDPCSRPHGRLPNDSFVQNVETMRGCLDRKG